MQFNVNFLKFVICVHYTYSKLAICCYFFSQIKDISVIHNFLLLIV